MTYRLAFAIVTYFEYGGLQRDLNRMATACANQGHQVHLITSKCLSPKPDSIELHLVNLNANTNHRW
ncbi:MAG: hypothetical protein IID32_12125 [Planctomycetes bacterium]|nr:hypothetical protein [Planctomycetota bacterium]